jgi:hypothetical protein
MVRKKYVFEIKGTSYSTLWPQGYVLKRELVTHSCFLVVDHHIG